LKASAGYDHLADYKEVSYAIEDRDLEIGGGISNAFRGYCRIEKMLRTGYRFRTLYIWCWESTRNCKLLFSDAVKLERIEGKFEAWFGREADGFV
jgi:hypothetical protein